MDKDTAIKEILMNIRPHVGNGEALDFAITCIEKLLLIEDWLLSAPPYGKDCLANEGYKWAQNAVLYIIAGVDD